MIENLDEIIYIHDNEENNIAKCNLLHDMINPFKRAKNINIHCYPILHGCINTRKSRAKFKNLRIILNIGYSYTIVMIRLVEIIHPEMYTVMQCKTQVVDITTNIKVKVDSALPALSATNVVTWKCHVDDSARSRYNMILGRDILT